MASVSFVLLPEGYGQTKLIPVDTKFHRVKSELEVIEAYFQPILLHQLGRAFSNYRVVKSVQPDRQDFLQWQY